MTAHTERAHWLPDLLRQAAFARAYTLTTLATVFASFAIQELAGLATYVTIVVGLCAVGVGILAARRREISFLRLVPVSLIVFALWCGVSVFWSTSRSDTLVGWLALLAIAFLALVVGHIRDTLQTVRALGDVMRWLLSISLGLEILIGVLLRDPLHLLGIEGDIDRFGPIQGIFGTRNLLGFVAVLALITFVVEWRTASVTGGVTAYSVAVGGAAAVLSKSPTVFVLAVAVGLATGILILVRRAAPSRRASLQWGLGALVAIAVISAYLSRHMIIAWIGAGSDFSVRRNLWRVLSLYVRFHPVEGFGWFGAWPQDAYPFLGINYSLDRDYTTALNAYADLVLQVGWVGFFLFIGMAGIAVARSWLVAGERRSVLYAWTPLILVALATASLFESFVLFGAGWLILVICLVRAGQTRSWRERIDVAVDDPSLPIDEGS